MNKKIPYDLSSEEIDELRKKKKEISDFVFEKFKSDSMNKEINWKEAHDMQQKLVVGYVLENEKLKDRIKKLEISTPAQRDKARTELDLWRDGNILHEIHRNELEEAERELDEARRLAQWFYTRLKQVCLDHPLKGNVRGILARLEEAVLDDPWLEETK